MNRFQLHRCIRIYQSIGLKKQQKQLIQDQNKLHIVVEDLAQGSQMYLRSICRGYGLNSL